MEVVYELLPLFCDRCCTIEHNLSNCRSLHHSKGYDKVDPGNKLSVEEYIDPKKLTKNQIVAQILMRWNQHRQHKL